ncbi:MAG: hypothetical protein HYX93_00455 [Chloroflexi bacterium]|nr:hypothetical protein [Chloroflexota bacterium]
MPMSFVNIVLTGVYLFYGWPAWSLTLISLGVLVAIFWGLSVRMRTAPEPVYTVKLYTPPAPEVQNVG